MERRTDRQTDRLEGQAKPTSWCTSAGSMCRKSFRACAVVTSLGFRGRGSWLSDGWICDHL